MIDTKIELIHDKREMTCDKIDKLNEEKCTYVSITNKLAKEDKDFEWVGSVTNKIKKEEKRKGKL